MKNKDSGNSIRWQCSWWVVYEVNYMVCSSQTMDYTHQKW